MKIDPIPNIAIDSIPDHSNASERTLRRKPTRRQTRNFFGITLSLLFLLWLMLGDFISDTYIVITFDGDPKAVKLAQGSGMNMNGMALFFSKSPEVISADKLHSHCPTENTELVEFGCYDPNQNKIYILQISNSPYSEIAYTTAAHEMLHAAWDELDEDERTDMSTLLYDHMSHAKDKYSISVKKSLLQYSKDKVTQSTELHSFIGSEINSTITNDRLDAHYAQYFSDRSESSDANNRFNDGLNSITSDIKARKIEMRNQESELNKYADEWLYSIESNMQQNLYYGDIYTYNKNVDAYNNNLKIYNNKYKSYEKFFNQLNADIEKHNETMNAMMPNKKIDTVRPIKSE